MSTLIFDNKLTGHHPEYLNHVYSGACRHSDENYIFALPESEWLKIKDSCRWPPAPNIRFRFITDSELAAVNHHSKFSRSLSLSRLIKKIAVEQGVDRILLISLADVIPFLPLMLPRSIKVSGIIYKIYLRSNPSGMKKAVDYIRYSVMARCSTVDKVFILNDLRSARQLNEIYSTTKFISLADPVPQPDMTLVEDLRRRLDIPADTEIYLHFGAMDDRKGSLEILRGILLLHPDQLAGRCFIFAGKVSSHISGEFYRLVDECRSRGARIIVDDRFCPYEYLFSLVFTADRILIPYLLTDLSSGALGYAAVFNKPVTGPAAGLIGSLIRDNDMGTVIDPVTPATIAEAILSPRPVVDGAHYARINSIDSFTNSFLG